MPKPKTKPVPKTKKSAARTKPAPTKVAAKKAAPKSATKKATAKIQPLDLSAFPPESVTVVEKWLCLACISDVFTRHMGLAARTAYLEISRYTPSVVELYAATERPWFANLLPQASCPYCGSPLKWHTRLRVYRIESGKATDALRRRLVKSLPKSGDQFSILEEKATQQHAFFEWLDKISTGLDFDNPDWLRQASRHYLNRKDPKSDWQAAFDQTHSIRRSRRLERHA